MSLRSLQRTIGHAELAKNVLRSRLATSEHARQQAQIHLSQRMGKLRGLPQKVGQLLSFQLPSENAQGAKHYAALQESVEPLPWESIRPHLADVWECDVKQVVAEIDPVGRAASLGQVHRARLYDGREVAIKVQYPGIREAVQTDLKMLGRLTGPIGKRRNRFDFDAYRELIAQDMERELNYRQEAACQRQLYSCWSSDDTLIVPHVVSELSSSTVLVSVWEDGEHWNQTSHTWSTPQRQQLAEALFRVFFKGLFQHGLMQADWHPGNLRFRRQDGAVQIVMYDYGCMCQPSRNQRLALARLIRSTIQGSEPPWPLFLALGFDPEMLAPLSDKLPALCRVLFEPFCAEHPYDVADWKLSERVAAVLGNDRWNFRIAAPPDLIFVVRAFHGLIYYLKGLSVTANWRAPFQETIELLSAQMDRLPLPADEAKTGYENVSTRLKIRVAQNGQTRAQITQAAANIERLDELLSEDLRRRIDEQGISLAALVAAVRRRAYAPGPVFHLVKGDKHIDVWLE